MSGNETEIKIQVSAFQPEMTAIIKEISCLKVIFRGGKDRKLNPWLTLFRILKPVPLRDNEKYRAKQVLKNKYDPYGF